MKTGPFEGKSVAITGAGRGIARQVAIDFAADGARVAVATMAAGGEPRSLLIHLEPDIGRSGP